MEINERKEKIDQFLKTTFKKVVDNGFISLKMIYHELIKYGIDDIYKNIDISNEVFPALINKNNQINKKYGKNNSGYVDYKNFFGNFCVFCNGTLLKDGDPVKLYMAWKPEYVVKNVDLIIDFMVKNNISYYLKVAKEVRNDMVTIRIGDITDAYKVIDFINNNLQHGYIKNNPFCIGKGIVGLAIDNYNSYNSRVENLIGTYYKYKIFSGKTDVSYDDFVNFVSHFNYTKNNESDKNVRNNPIFLNEIKNLIYKALTTNDIREFENHYYSVSKNRGKKKIKVKDSSISFEILSLFVDSTIKKHDKYFATNGLAEYFKSGFVRGLSRIDDKNGRELLNNVDRNYVINVLINKYGVNDIYEIAERFVEERSNLIINNNRKNKNLSLFASVAKDTYQKYGYEHTVMAIVNFLNNGYMNNFTRKSLDDKICRDLLKQIDYNDIKGNLIEIYNIYNIEDLVKCFMDNYVVDSLPKTR